MAANTLPIFSKAGVVTTVSIPNGIALLVTSNGVATTGVTGLTGEMVLCFTADATNGSYIQKIRLRPVASVATTQAANTIRLYISSVSSGATTAANTTCFEEIAWGSQAAANASTVPFYVDVPCGFILPAGKTILASVQSKPTASTEIAVITYAGNY
jgi:hypothetical protein